MTDILNWSLFQQTIIVTLILTCLFLVFLHYYITCVSRKGRFINSIPGYVQFPIFGNALKVVGYSLEEIWSFVRDTAKLYYPITRFWAFTTPLVVTSHPDHVEKLLSSTKHTIKGFNYKFLRPWLHDGLFVSKGTKWQNRRKLAMSGFHFSLMKQFVEIMIAESNATTESLNHVDELIIEDLLLFTSNHTLNVICETSMGISLKDLGSYGQQYQQAVQNICNILSIRFHKPWLLNNTLFRFTSVGREQKKCLNILHSFTEEIIANRKNYHEQTGRRYLKNLENHTETEDTEVARIKKKKLALLDILIAESYKNGLTDLDIREEVDTFIIAGYDTVAISACFSLLLLAEHKDIQERVRKEVCEVIRENGGKLTMNALHNLSYLGRCLKESLRMYPSGFFISRVCNEDMQLGPYLVPGGTSVFILIYELHHDPNFWPNPEIFDPDRFLPENVQKRHPYSYIPFSAGPRNCIGQRFAMLELKALIASMVYNFYLEPVDYLKDMKFKMNILLHTARPMRMKIIPIKRT